LSAIKPTIGLGVLSWRGAASLEQALKSYAAEDFFSLFADVLIYLPDPDEAVLKIANAFPARIETDARNEGILAGMEQVARRLQTDYIFLTENDCPLLESRAESARQISKAIDLLSRGEAKMARMRHRQLPGEAFGTLNKYKRYFPAKDTMAAKLRRVLRPGKAKRLAGTSVYADPGPHKKFPNWITDAGDGFYLVESSIMPWTNQSVIINREFFLSVLLPHCYSVPFTRGANGFRNMEVEMNNSGFWRKSGWKIACAPGLLTHKRAESRGY
jgi:hypothetical protein